MRPSKTRHRERRTDRHRERGIISFAFLLYLRPIYQSISISPFLCFSEAHDSAFHLVLLLVSRTREKKKKEKIRKKINYFVGKEKIDRSRTRNSQFEDLDTCDRQLISIAAWNTLAAIFLVGLCFEFWGRVWSLWGRSFGSGDRERGGVGRICLSDRKGKR